jgi:hypothetical protein
MKDKHFPIRQGFGDAALSCLPMSAFLIWMKAMSWAISRYDPHDHYDSRIGMIFPLILPLFFLGVVFGIRACRTVVRLYQQVPFLLTIPIILGIAGLLVPFFLGLFLAVRFLIQHVLL